MFSVAAIFWIACFPPPRISMSSGLSLSIWTDNFIPVGARIFPFPLQLASNSYLYTHLFLSCSSLPLLFCSCSVTYSIDDPFVNCCIFRYLHQKSLVLLPCLEILGSVTQAAVLGRKIKCRKLLWLLSDCWDTDVLLLFIFALQLFGFTLCGNAIRDSGLGYSCMSAVSCSNNLRSFRRISTRDNCKYMIFHVPMCLIEQDKWIENYFMKSVSSSKLLNGGQPLHFKHWFTKEGIVPWLSCISNLGLSSSLSLASSSICWVISSLASTSCVISLVVNVASISVATQLPSINLSISIPDIALSLMDNSQQGKLIYKMLMMNECTVIIRIGRVDKPNYCMEIKKSRMNSKPSSLKWTSRVLSDRQTVNGGTGNLNDGVVSSTWGKAQSMVAVNGGTSEW